MNECPQCGRQLTSDNGRIGYCTYHKTWYAVSRDAQAEAEEANRRELEKQKKKAEELKRQERLAEREAQRKKLARLLAAAALICLLAGVGVFAWYQSVIVPGEQYRQAQSLLAEGQYEEAGAAFRRAEGYKDSRERAEICTAVTELRSGEAGAALEWAELLLALPEMYSAERWSGTVLTPEETLTLSAELLMHGAEKDYTPQYREAALQVVSASEACDHEFGDWDGDGLEELLLLDEEGELALYAYKDGWACIAAWEAVRSYSVEGERLSYTAALPGSALREGRFSASLSEPASGSTLVRVDWHEADYEEPADAKAAVLRYAEATVYGIDEEKAHLSAEDGALPEGFSFERLESFALTGLSEKLEVHPYYQSDEHCFAELSYEEGGESRVLYIALSLRDGVWRLSGCAETYSAQADLDPERTQYEATLLCFNGETEADSTAAPGEWRLYRLLLPETSRVWLGWKSEAEGASWQLTLIDQEAGALAVFSPERASKKETESYSVYLDAGEYYLRVLNKGDAKQLGYELSLYAQPGSWAVQPLFGSRSLEETEEEELAETEPNNSAATASALKEGTLCAAASGTVTDEDWFTYTAPEDGLFTAELVFDEVESQEVLYEVELYRDDLLLGSFTGRGCDGGVFISDLPLPAATYLLRVKCPGWSNLTSYRLSAGMKSAEVEAEYNNALDCASALVPGTEVHGILMNVTEEQSGGDIDNYSLALSSDASVRITLFFETDVKEETLFHVTLADASKQKILTAALSAAENGLATEAVFIGAGEYDVQISGTKKAYGLPYALLVEAMQTEEGVQTEIEKNDSYETATPIEVNLPVTGACSDKEDVDHFSFVLEEDGRVCLSLGYEGSESEAAAYKAALSDGKRLIQNTVFRGTEAGKSSTPVLLEAGSYDVKLEHPESDAGSYSLTVEYEAVSGVETEPNGSADKATELTEGEVLHGILSGEKDQDFYRLRFEETTTVELHFAAEAAEDSETVFKLLIRKGERTLKSTEVRAGDGELMQKLKFEAGTYELEVLAETWGSELYSLYWSKD